MAALRVKALNCPNCGAALALRTFDRAVNVVCEHCLAVLDARDPSFRVLQTATAKERIQPLIPLGTRGKMQGVPYEVIGFQVRTIMVDGTAYSWTEYLLFNPYKGFRYLTEYQGHWNDVTTLKSLPEVRTKGRPVATALGRQFRHFQTATAETTYVVGEFPWQVRAGDRARVMDFVAPPRMLSSETTDEETTWSMGEYMTGKAVWQAFQLPGSPPRAVGVFANQPSPHTGRVITMWLTAAVLLASLFTLSQVFLVFCRSEQVFQGGYSFSPRTGGEASFVTDVFELKGRPSSVEVATEADLSNNWIYLNYALIDVDSGQAYNFGREVSYYSGRDSDGDWSEGNRRDSALVPSVPAGRYYLRVEPEMDPNAAPVSYRIKVRRDVPAFSFFWIAAALLLVPPALKSFQALAFESKRWKESDYASTGDD